MRVGHAGTLDPFATGLLIIGIGKATRALGKLAGLDKEYEAMLQLGATSDTYDRTGKITIPPSPLPSREGLGEGAIKKVLQKFIGTIEQVPPMYSAKKVRGKKLYELARRGIEVKRKPSHISIYELELRDEPSPTLSPSQWEGEKKEGVGRYPLPVTGYRLRLRIRCSSGTYIRALAHDIGRALGCGAYLEELRRTMIGPFSIEEARPIALLTVENLPTHLKSTREILEQARIV